MGILDNQMEAKRARLRTLRNAHFRHIDRQRVALRTRWQFGEISDEYYQKRDQDLAATHRRYVEQIEDEWNRLPRWYAWSVMALLMAVFWAVVAWVFGTD